MKEMLERLRQTNALIELLQTANAKIDLQSGLIIAKMDGEILYLSPGACAIFEHSQRRIPGERLEMLMPERYRKAHSAGLARVANGGPSTLTGRNLSLVGLTKTGREVAILLRIEVRDTDEYGRLLIGRVYSHPDVDRSLLLRVEAGRE